MKITVEFELTENNARMLRTWASVGRLFDSAIREIETLQNEVGDNTLNCIVEDLQRMKQPLDSVHHQLRAALADSGIEKAYDNGG